MLAIEVVHGVSQSTETCTIEWLGIDVSEQKRSQFGGGSIEISRRGRVYRPIANINLLSQCNFITGRTVMMRCHVSQLFGV